MNKELAKNLSNFMGNAIKTFLDESFDPGKYIQNKECRNFKIYAALSHFWELQAIIKEKHDISEYCNNLTALPESKKKILVIKGMLEGKLPEEVVSKAPPGEDAIKSLTVAMVTFLKEKLLNAYNYACDNAPGRDLSKEEAEKLVDNLVLEPLTEYVKIFLTPETGENILSLKDKCLKYITQNYNLIPDIDVKPLPSDLTEKLSKLGYTPPATDKSDGDSDVSSDFCPTASSGSPEGTPCNSLPPSPRNTQEPNEEKEDVPSPPPPTTASPRISRRGNKGKCPPKDCVTM